MDQSLHNTRPLAEDFMFSAGAQEANVGPAQPNVTATVGNVAEQSRMTVAASNVDDLDMLLTQVALCGGQLIMWEMSPEVVKHVVGVGAVWPEREPCRLR